MIKLLNIQYIKDTTVIQNNLEDGVLSAILLKCQRYYLIDAIGSKLYKDIENRVKNNNITGLYLELMNDYIAPFLSEWTVYEGLLSINFQITQQGVVKKISETSQSIDIDEMKLYRNNVKNAAEFFSTELKLFIKENKNTFICYCTESEFEIKPSKSGYDIGIYLD